MSDFCLPSFGADMEAAKIVAWNVKPGDKFKRGDIIVAVETDKGIIDIEIYDEGVVDRILVEPDTRVRVGSVLATYHAEGAAPSLAATPNAAPEPEVKPAATIGPVTSTIEASRKRVSPAARQRARELNIDIERIIGTGPHGAVTIEDVEAAAKAIAPAVKETVESSIETVQPATEAAQPQREIAQPQGETARRGKETAEAASGMRRVIAAAMARSKREIPHYYLSTTIDMTRALRWLENINANRPIGERVVYAVLLLKAVARALQKTPELNGLYADDSFHPASTFHIGVAISLRGGGLVLPTLHDVDSKPLPELMRDFDDLITRARSGHLRASELQDSTITVTSLGEQGVDSVYPIIFPPQVAIVGFGSIIERPWAVDGMLAVRRVINATLAADHRVSDGHRGGLFLAALNRYLQEPESL